MVLVRFGWIHTKFCSFALVVWHRLQQRKLILAKNETRIKHKNTIKTQNRQKQPDKIHQKKTQQNQKTKATKTILTSFDMFWLFCVFLVCFFSVCSGFVFFKPLYSLCCSAQKPGIQKGSKQTPYSNFWLERKRRVKNVWKEGGTGPPLLRIHFLNFWVRYWLDFRHGWTYGWIWLDTHTKSNQILLYVLVYKQILPSFFFGSKEKESSKMYEWGGGQAHPSLEYISGLIMIGCGPG